jgi:hypothetical protein
MEPVTYEDFTQRLISSLARDPRIVGLVALGSMAGVSYAPDR